MAETEARYVRLHRALAELGTPLSGEDDLDEYLGEIPLKAALACAALFCPPLLEVDGMIAQNLVTGYDTDERWARAVRRFLEKYGDPRAVERHLNIIEIGRLIGPLDEPSHPHAELVLAEFVADAWRGWLALRFPDRAFDVSVVAADEEYIDEVGVTFVQRQS